MTPATTRARTAGSGAAPLLLALLACGPAGAADRADPIPVILDTDLGDDIDDTWALGLVLKCPELDVKLVVGDQGKALYRAGLIAKILERAGRTDIPVGVGLDVNRKGGGPQSKWLGAYDLDAYPGKVHRDGVRAIIDTIINSPRPITLIATGPLPNVAAALQREPRIAERARFVGMHGSVRLGYGGRKEISAEYNVRGDAPACRKVFTAAWPITITPLDTCGLVHLTGEEYARVRDSKDPIASAIIENYRIWAANRSGGDAKVADSRSSTLFDTVAVYLAFRDELVKIEELGIRVTDDGFTRIDPKAKEMRVATEWRDRAAFERFLADRVTQRAAGRARGEVRWKHLSSTRGDLPDPAVGRQVATLIMDVDGDGVNDFVVLSYEKMAWFRRIGGGWRRYAVENGAPGVRMEAGGDFWDIDGDGDPDILEGAQSRAGEIWWWENPRPDFTPDRPWKRHEVIAVGGTHHDQIFGDFDGDGRAELAFWHNGGKRLYLAEIPEDPAKPWPVAEIARLDPEGGNPEGLAKIDIDLDGTLDIVGGGHWFEHIEGKRFETHPIDPGYRFTRSAAGDLIAGGRPEVVIGSGDGVGPLNVYRWDGKAWRKQTLVERVDHGHSLQVGDINGDGHLDIYAGEMHSPGAGPRCRQWILYGDGRGAFNTQLLSEGIGSHESRVGDLDGDGDLDLLQKDFQKDRRVDVWLNLGVADEGDG